MADKMGEGFDVTGEGAAYGSEKEEETSSLRGTPTVGG